MYVLHALGGFLVLSINASFSLLHRDGEKTLLITKARSAEQSVIWRYRFMFDVTLHTKWTFCFCMQTCCIRFSTALWRSLQLMFVFGALPLLSIIYFRYKPPWWTYCTVIKLLWHTIQTKGAFRYRYWGKFVTVYTIDPPQHDLACLNTFNCWSDNQIVLRHNRLIQIVLV